MRTQLRKLLTGAGAATALVLVLTGATNLTPVAQAAVSPAQPPPAPATATASQCLQQWDATGGSDEGWFEPGWPETIVADTTIANGPHAGERIALTCGYSLFGVVHIARDTHRHAISTTGSDDANVVACVNALAAATKMVTGKEDQSLYVQFPQEGQENGQGSAYMFYHEEYGFGYYIYTMYTTGGDSGNDWQGCTLGT
jgi:hypothetical protein